MSENTTSYPEGLTVEEREILVDKLLESLDSSPKTEADQAWLAEAEDRYRRYKAGESSAVSIEDVLAEACAVKK